MDVFFPRAQRVLDSYRATEHLGDLAKTDRGDEATSAKDLSGRWSHQIKHEGGGAILAPPEG